MKVNSAMFAMLVFFSSCASYAPKTYNQQCGEKGMVLKGITSSSGSTSSYSYQTNSYVAGSYDGENVSCEVPQNEVQKCEAELYNESAAPINEYNSNVRGKRALLFLGYLTFVVPGAFMDWIFTRQQAEVEAKSAEQLKQVSQKCSTPDSRIPANTIDDVMRE